MTAIPIYYDGIFAAYGFLLIIGLIPSRGLKTDLRLNCDLLLRETMFVFLKARLKFVKIEPSGVNSPLDQNEVYH